MSDTHALKGIAWDHQRGAGVLRDISDSWLLDPAFGPSTVTRVDWDARSLQSFADASIIDLSRDYDLLVIDHPFIGLAARSGAFVPLEQHLPAGYIAGQEAQSVGRSHRSYQWNGHQWALAMDAAAQVSAFRADLMPRPPSSWRDVLTQASDREWRWRFALPFVPIDALCLFFSICANMGAEPFSDPAVPIHIETGSQAIEFMAKLTSVVVPDSLQCNPIHVLDRMLESEDWAYSPALFGYSNYSRLTLGAGRVTFAPLPSAGLGGVGGVIGGAGIAVSATSSHRDDAIRYAAWVCSPQVQSGLYVDHGGQPGSRAAWLDASVNEVSGDFFARTLPGLDSGYLRPRYPGFTDFQDEAGPLLRSGVLNRRNPGDLARALRDLAFSTRTRFSVEA